MVVYSCSDKLLICVWIDDVASQYDILVGVIVALFAVIFPDNVNDWSISKLFIVNDLNYPHIFPLIHLDCWILLDLIHSL